MPEEARRVLVVDDDTFLHILLSMELPSVDLLEASRLDEAYEVAKAERPDAILLDVKLADGDGIDLLRRIRRTAPLAQTPVLVITAGHDEARRPEMLQAGADEYLPKPIDAPDLIARLERILAVPPSERRGRRQTLLERIGHRGGDPDPVRHPSDARSAPASRRRGLFRRRS